MSRRFVRSCASVVRTFFYGNIFLALLVVCLSIETAFQFAIPLASSRYYLLIALLVILYYTYAYTRHFARYDSRGRWYARYRSPIRQLRWTAYFLALLLTLSWLYHYWEKGLALSWQAWLVMLSFPCVAYCYYSSKTWFRWLNLRQVGELKPFVIGYVWAGVTVVFPYFLTGISTSISLTEILLFFLHNWTFFTANAILFDVKDLKVDTHFSLQTFVVRWGRNRTINGVVYPLLALSGLAQLYFQVLQSATLFRSVCQLIPFVILLFIIKKLQKADVSVLYYLIMVDGILLLKAVLGILSVSLAL